MAKRKVETPKMYNHPLVVDNFKVANDLLVKFKDAYISQPTNIMLTEAEKIFTLLVKANNYQIFCMGMLLVHIKNKLHHGEFGIWIDKMDLFSRRTANNYMNVYTTCLGHPKLIKALKRSVLEEVCSPKFSEIIRNHLSLVIDDDYCIYTKKDIDKLKKLHEEGKLDVNNEYWKLFLMTNEQRKYDSYTINAICDTILYIDNITNKITKNIEYAVKCNSTTTKNKTTGYSSFLNLLNGFKSNLIELKDEYYLEDSVERNELFCEEIRSLNEKYKQDLVKEDSTPCKYEKVCTYTQWKVEWSAYKYRIEHPFDIPYPYYPEVDSANTCNSRCSISQNKPTYDLKAFKENVLTHFVSIEIVASGKDFEEGQPEIEISEEQARARHEQIAFEQLGPEDFVHCEMDDQLAEKALKKWAKSNLGPQDFSLKEGAEDDLDEQHYQEIVEQLAPEELMPAKSPA